MSNRTETHSISDTATLTGVSISRIRNWERQGYIQAPIRIVCGDRAYRRYSAEEVNRIKAIKTLLDEGFTLAHAAQTIATGENGGQP
jgi:DNA-binding transcriptional MerR regulator